MLGTVTRSACPRMEAACWGPGEVSSGAEFGSLKGTTLSPCAPVAPSIKTSKCFLLWPKDLNSESRKQALPSHFLPLAVGVSYPGLRPPVRAALTEALPPGRGLRASGEMLAGEPGSQGVQGRGCEWVHTCMHLHVCVCVRPHMCVQVCEYACECDWVCHECVCDTTNVFGLCPRFLAQNS